MDALLLKVPEAANQLGISRAKLYELIADGTIPAVKIGGCRRIRLCDLHDYVARLPIGEACRSGTSGLRHRDVAALVIPRLVASVGAIGQSRARRVSSRGRQQWPSPDASPDASQA
jgi:excisionase family DNA binding protein